MSPTARQSRSHVANDRQLDLRLPLAGHRRRTLRVPLALPVLCRVEQPSHEPTTEVARQAKLEESMELLTSIHQPLAEPVPPKAEPRSFDKVSRTGCVTYQSAPPRLRVSNILPTPRRGRGTGGEGATLAQTLHEVSGTGCLTYKTLSPPAARRAFTLVEMLAVVAIIAILASVLLGALFVATEHAREERTRSLISKLHNQLMQRWEEYETRRVPLIVPTGAQPDAIALAQLIFLYETMRMELPDIYEDLNFQYYNPAFASDFQSEGLAFGWQDITPFVRPDADPLTAPPAVEYLPAITRAYQQRVIAAAVANGANPSNGVALAQAIKKLGDANTSAEMLYLIMTTASGDEDSGGTHFSSKDIADTDGDNMPEFVDAWGKPLRWIRWPSGYVNDPSMVGLTIPTSSWGLITDLVSGSPPDNPIDPDPNPFDPRRVVQPTVTADSEPGGVAPPSAPPLKQNYRLVPLVMSAGPDGEFGVRFDRDDSGLSAADRATLMTNYTDPYYWWDVSGSGEYVRRGTPGKLDITTGNFDPLNGEWVHLDNITNHLTEAE